MTDGKINQKHTDSAISTAYILNNSYRKSSIIIGKKLIINMKEITGQSDSSRVSAVNILAVRDISASLMFPSKATYIRDGSQKEMKCRRH
jgi:hypothetical protein